MDEDHYSTPRKSNSGCGNLQQNPLIMLTSRQTLYFHEIQTPLPLNAPQSTFSLFHYHVMCKLWRHHRQRRRRRQRRQWHQMRKNRSLRSSIVALNLFLHTCRYKNCALLTLSLADVCPSSPPFCSSSVVSFFVSPQPNQLLLRLLLLTQTPTTTTTTTASRAAAAQAEAVEAEAVESRGPTLQNQSLRKHHN